MPCSNVSFNPRSIKRVASSFMGASCISLSQARLLVCAGFLGFAVLFRLGGSVSTLLAFFEARLLSGLRAGLGAGVDEVFLRETNLLKSFFNL